MSVSQTMRAGERYRRRMFRKSMFVLGALLILAIAVCVDVGVGPGLYSPAEVLTALFSPDSVAPKLSLIVWDIRLPVALMAVLVGAMLGIAGAQMQTILHNPLADPFTLGISSAASFGAALAIALGVGLWPGSGSFLVTVNAFIFALATSLVLFVFTRMRGVTIETFVLVGIALFFTFNALLAFIQYRSSEAQLQQIVFWMMGSLGRASWTKIAICAGLLALVIPLSLLRNGMMTALAMGDDRAASLGVPVSRLRLEMLASISLLAATATAFVGTIGFVGLVGPHIARMILGEDQRFFLPGSVLAGALLLSVTSIVSKSIIPGVVFPIGIITALVGVPFFISLILSNVRRSW